MVDYIWRTMLHFAFFLFRLECNYIFIIIFIVFLLLRFSNYNHLRNIRVYITSR